MRERESLGETSFSVSARVAMQLGRESISNSIVAILELVKNAYDADAGNVKVSFSPPDSGDRLLIIEDDGSGMTRAQLVDNWMVIGTDNKLTSRTSPGKKRVLTGEKGLGRLGLDRLAGITIVQSFTAKETHGIEVEIDWAKYERTSKRLEEVTHNLYRIEKTVHDPITGETQSRTNGTILMLRDLKDDWTQEELTKLRRQLALLVSPFAAPNDFSVWFRTGLNLAALDGEIQSGEMLEAAEWHLVSLLALDGTVSHKMVSRDGAAFDFSQPWKKVFAQDIRTGPTCGPIEFQMYFYSREGANGVTFDKKMIDDFLEANQGIRIYRDGFRVMPYGEPSGEGDWLNLALRRVRNPQGVRQGPWKVGYNQIVGAVFIGREANPGLLDQTNREGLVEERAYFDLRKFMLSAVEFFEEHRGIYERSRKKTRRFEDARAAAKKAAREARAATTRLRTDVNRALKQLEKSGVKVEPTRSALDTSLDQAEALIKEASEAQEELGLASEEQQREFESQKDTLGNLASLGILAATFGHETLGYANLVLNNLQLLKQNVNALLMRREDAIGTELTQNVRDIEHAAQRIETFAEFTLKNVRRDKRTRKQVNLSRVVRDVFTSFGDELKDKRGIAVELAVGDNIPPVFAFPIDWESIIINFITNAVWALENTPRNQRKIRVRLHSKKGKVLLSFADSGSGIEPGVIDRIFEPNFSRKRNERGDIVGTGMGLAIVDNFVYTYGGTIKVDAHSDLGGAEFNVEIPVQVTRGRKVEPDNGD